MSSSIEPKLLNSINFYAGGWSLWRHLLFKSKFVALKTLRSQRPFFNFSRLVENWKCNIADDSRNFWESKKLQICFFFDFFRMSEWSKGAFQYENLNNFSRLAKKYRWRLFKLIKGQNLRKKLDYRRLKLNSLHRDNPPASAISNSAIIRVIVTKLSIKFWHLRFWPRLTEWSYFWTKKTWLFFLVLKFPI